MKQIVYPLIATSLITIAPFLSTFEKGQDIIRGLFDFSVLALLLLFVLVRDKASVARKPLMGCVFVVLFLVAVADLQNVLSYKGWSISWRIIIPLITCSVAIVILKPVKAFSLRGFSFFMFIALMSHIYMYQFFPSQPLWEFPVAKWLARTVNNPDWPRKHLSEDFRAFHNVTDSISITRYYVDTVRCNVIILVESWGIPMDSSIFAKELALFNGLMTERRVHFRMSSRTRAAERVDLLDSAWRSPGHRDSLYMPNRFAQLGYQTSFFFGGDSTIQWRYKYIRRIGFQQEFWTDSTTSDAVMAEKIDSLLAQSDSVKHFVAWTTRDTRFPISDDAVETEKLYYERLFGTLQIVAELAKKHPDVRFVVQGDHEPILSPIEFQRKFYRRWVPFVVLN